MVVTVLGESSAGGDSQTGRRLYSAVLDPRGWYPAQLERLVWSLSSMAGVQCTDIIVHVVGEAPGGTREWLQRKGVETVRIEPFPGHPYSNKLQQLASLVSLCADRQRDEVVMLDCDIIAMGIPPSARGGIRAKIVDLPNPPIEVLRVIFHEAGLPLVAAATDVDASPTAWGNANGGVYVVSSAWLGVLDAVWPQWVRWCLERPELFKGRLTHVDQVGFALAVTSSDLPFLHLDRRFNFPTHINSGVERDCEPVMLHYHNHVDDDGRLLEVPGLTRVNAAIARVNSLLAMDGMLPRWLVAP